MKQHIRGLSILVLGIAAISISGCATCGTSYRRELSQNSKLAEANKSYKKAIVWLDKAECTTTPFKAKESYRTAQSYLTDALSKLEEQGHKHNIDVSEDVYYIERMKTETDVKIGAAERGK